MSGNEDNRSIFPWGNERRFNSYTNYFRKIFGERVQKVSINAGFTCPNRDGYKSTGGCTYCVNDAFNPSYCRSDKSVTVQIREGIDFHKKRYRRASSYLAYFQAYSNTYASPEILRELYEEALRFPGVIGLIIGTRPDCIDEQKLGYMKDLAQKYYVAVEYGIETCYDKTLQRINRAHTFADAVNAVRLTAEYGINTGAHFIFGLPGETVKEMLEEALIISELPLTTIKFHQLQIIKGTVIEREYMTNPADFKLLTWEEYLSFIIRFLEHFTPEIMIERFTGEVPPKFLAVTPWGSKRNDQISGLIEKRLEELDTWQGRLYRR
jgi:radical SAM protein (TIGR01212 family)